MFELALLGALIWLCKSAAEDVMHAKNGTPNPRYEMKRAKAAARGERYQQPRYGSADYFADLKADFLQERTRLRREKAAAKAEERQTATIEVPFIDEVPQPTPKPVQPDGPDVVPAPPTPSPTKQATDLGEGETDRPARRNATTVGPGIRPAAENVVQFARRTSEKENAVTTQTETTEVIGLDQAIDYARRLAANAGAHGAAGNETYPGRLQQAKIAGAGIQTAHDMQAAFTAAAEAAETHAKTLEGYKNVQEAYNAAPDAPDKQFATAGQ